MDDINVSFPEKGMVFIIGKSGSGKSTLLNMMAGLASPDKGEVLFNGRNVTKMKEKDLDFYHYQDIAFIFQNYCIMEELSVEENVALGKEENPRNIKDEIEDVLNKVGLLQQRKKKAKYLSGGEKQRVAIARAIVKKPSIIVSDEPTGNLDKQSSKDVLSILKEYSKEGLVIIVSHNLFDAYEYGDRIITLD
ncbi:MAG: ATP-binding cassette domain-containing protein, partial [Anaerobutyricum hallii]|uniref:ABC transporter ATP-binding protein n=1 Tax=Anaerobutyricum hallii TaxID=39488 RepID=UPI002A823FD1